MSFIKREPKEPTYIKYEVEDIPIKVETEGLPLVPVKIEPEESALIPIKFEPEEAAFIPMEIEPEESPVKIEPEITTFKIEPEEMVFTFRIEPENKDEIRLKNHVQEVHHFNSQEFNFGKISKNFSETTIMNRQESNAPCKKHIRQNHIVYCPLCSTKCFDETGLKQHFHSSHEFPGRISAQKYEKIISVYLTSKEKERMNDNMKEKQGIQKDDVDYVE